jgi:hypothetical protein
MNQTTKQICSTLHDVGEDHELPFTSSMIAPTSPNYKQDHVVESLEVFKFSTPSTHDYVGVNLLTL